MMDVSDSSSKPLKASDLFGTLGSFGLAFQSSFVFVKDKNQPKSPRAIGAFVQKVLPWLQKFKTSLSAFICFASKNYSIRPKI
jgi:hypothetical protein